MYLPSFPLDVSQSVSLGILVVLIRVSGLEQVISGIQAVIKNPTHHSPENSCIELSLFFLIGFP